MQPVAWDRDCGFASGGPTPVFTGGLRLPLLVTGITGVSGYNAWLYFRQLYPGQVIGIRPPKTWQLVAEDVEVVDIADGPGVAGLFRRYRFGSVLHCAGNCALKACELDPEMAHAINVDGARNIANAAKTHGSRLVFLSTDLVFSGIGDGNYTEECPVDPVTVYGKTMAQAEQLVYDIEPTAALLRISLPMGPSFNRHAGAIDWIDSRFRKDRKATLYYDEVRSATYVDDMNKVYERMLACDAHGLFHMGGPRPISLFQIAQVVNRVGGYEPTLLQGCMRIEAGPIPPRAGNVSMNSTKLHRLFGENLFRPWPQGDDVTPTHPQWHFDRNEPGGMDAIRNRLYRYPI